MNVDRKTLVWGLGALLVILIGVALGLNATKQPKVAESGKKVEIAAREKARLQDACASAATYARLKQVAFDEAVRIRNADPANLDLLATHSVVRMENPVVKSRDEALNVTVCSGRFVLELPPGAERGFGGERRLAADIEYAAQAAADGSGLVYRIQGAEPIIYKLAAFDLQGQGVRPAAPREPTDYAEAAPVHDSVPVAATLPAPKAPPAPAAVVTPTRSNPSFNCRHAGTRSEKMVCSSNQLAARDRAMSSLYYSSIADADPATKRRIRGSRDSFLVRRERCATEACVANAYEQRIEEIRRIADDRE